VYRTLFLSPIELYGTAIRGPKIKSFKAMRIVADDVKTLLTLDNIEVFSPQKLQFPGDLAIRYAAIVLATLTIAYK